MTSTLLLGQGRAACISVIASLLLLLQGQGGWAQEVGFTLRTGMPSTAMVKSQHIFHIERESHSQEHALSRLPAATCACHACGSLPRPGVERVALQRKRAAGP